MSDIISFQPQRAWDKNGKAVSGALATFFLSGTTTPVTVYSDLGETVPHPSPLQANSRGVFAPVYRGGIALRVVVTDPDGVVLPGYPIDPTITVSAGGSGANQISFTPSANIPETNVQDAIDRVQANVDTAVSNTSLRFISRQVANNSATLSFTGFDPSLYDGYVFYLSQVLCDEDDRTFRLQTSSDGGATWATTIGDYEYGFSQISMGGSPAQSLFGGGLGSMILTTDVRALFPGSGINMQINILGPQLLGYTQVNWSGSHRRRTTNVGVVVQGAGQRLSTGVVNAVRFSFEPELIASGTITMYGLRNS